MSAAGEYMRMQHNIAILRALIVGLESTASADMPCAESAQAVADAAVRLVSVAARRDAYRRAGVP